MADATLKMVLLGDDRGASRALKHVGDEAQRTESRSHKLAAGFARVGKVAALGLAAGVGAAGVAMVGMVKNAAEDQAAQRRLAVALQNTAGATKAQTAGVEDWISKMGVATGVTDDEMRPALQRLVQATGDIGKAQGLMKLSLDASAGSGKSLEAVTTALSKAQNGNMGALSKLGIRIKDTSGKALTFDQVVKNMGETFAGQAAAKANSLDGKMQRLKLVFDETKETIGGALIPILTKLAGWFLDKGLPAIQGFFSGMQAGQGVAGGFGKILRGLGDVVKSVAHWIGNELVPFIKDLAHRFSEAMGGTAGFKKSLRDMEPAITLVKRVLGILWDGLKWAIRNILPVAVLEFKAMASAIGALGRMATWLWNNAFQPALRLIVRGIGGLLNVIGKMLSALGHVPGFGWAKEAGDKMQRAAQKTNQFANAIRDIPSEKQIRIKVRYSNNSGIGGADKSGYALTHNAVGTRNFAGGVTMVGERGPERVTLPRGSRIDTADRLRGMARHGNEDITVSAPLVLKLDSREVWQGMLQLKRNRGGVTLGLA